MVKKYMELNSCGRVVVIKNKREIRLTVLQLKDDRAVSTAKGIQDALNEYNLWGNVNTRKKTGVVTRLQ